MEIFKELIIKSDDSNKLEGFLKNVIENLPSDWKYKEEMVKNYTENLSKKKSEVGCFESPKIEDGRVANVWFVIWDTELKIVNIVPISGSLNYSQYNLLLEKFFEACVKPLLTDNIIVILKDGQLNISEVAGIEVYEALSKWEKSCNRDTGNTNPNDFERWADFVCLAYKYDTMLTATQLQRWLIEEKGWLDDYLVSKLVIDFEYGLSILQHNEFV